MWFSADETQLLIAGLVEAFEKCSHSPETHPKLTQAVELYSKKVAGLLVGADFYEVACDLPEDYETMTPRERDFASAQLMLKNKPPGYLNSAKPELVYSYQTKSFTAIFRYPIAPYHGIST